MSASNTNDVDLTGIKTKHILSKQNKSKSFQLGLSAGEDDFSRGILKLPSQKKYEKKLLEKSFELMEDLNIKHMANSYARELSGGQKKLLELARSIINDPEVL